MPRAGLTTERVTLLAADLADELGFEAVSISALARACGVKDASLYSHVRNLHDVRTRVAVLALGELADLVSAALAGRAGKDALVSFASAYRSYATLHPGRYAAAQFPLDDETAAASSAGRHAAMTRAILRGYSLDEPHETDAVRLLHSAFHGYVTLERSGGFARTARSADDSWSASLDALHGALTHWPRS